MHRHSCSQCVHFSHVLRHQWPQSLSVRQSLPAVSMEETQLHPQHTKTITLCNIGFFFLFLLVRQSILRTVSFYRQRLLHNAPTTVWIHTDPLTGKRDVGGERRWCHCSKYCRRLQQQRCIINLAGQEASRGNCINFNFKPKPEPEQCDLSGLEKNRTLINIRPLQSLPRDLNRWIKAAVGKRRKEKGTLCGQTHIVLTFSGSAVNTSLMTHFFILLCS